MGKPKNINYTVYEQRIKDIVISHADKDGISKFKIQEICISAYFNREYAEEFKKWLISNHIVDRFFDTRNSNYFECMVNAEFYRKELESKMFDNPERRNP